MIKIMHNSKQIIKIKIQHITQLKIEHTLLCTQILNREHPTTITWHPSDKQEHNHLKHSSQWYEPSLSQQKIPNSEHPIEHAIHSRSRQARKAAASNKKQKFNQQQRIEQQIFFEQEEEHTRGSANIRRRRKRQGTRWRERQVVHVLRLCIEHDFGFHFGKPKRGLYMFSNWVRPNSNWKAHLIGTHSGPTILWVEEKIHNCKRPSIILSSLDPKKLKDHASMRINSQSWKHCYHTHTHTQHIYTSLHACIKIIHPWQFEFLTQTQKIDL